MLTVLKYVVSSKTLSFSVLKMAAYVLAGLAGSSIIAEHPVATAVVGALAAVVDAIIRVYTVEPLSRKVS